MSTSYSGRSFIAFGLFLTAYLSQSAFSKTVAPAGPLSGTTDKEPGTLHGVRTRFIALDDHGQPLTDLKAEELRLRVNKHEQKIRSLSRALENPRIIGIFFDVSGSRKADKHIEKEIQGVSSFLRSVWRRGDRGFAVAFSDKHFTLAEPTEDLDKVVSALPTVTQEPYYGGTALYDALLSARFHQSNNDDIRLYVVLSDFEDNISNHSRSNLVAELKKNGITVFPVLLGQNFTPLFSKKGHKRSLEAATEVANQTGGEVLEPISEKDIEPQLQRIANALQGTYWIQCEPLPEGTIIKSVQLDSTRPRIRILYAQD